MLLAAAVAGRAVRQATFSQGVAGLSIAAYRAASSGARSQWDNLLRTSRAPINPCNSRLHPAVVSGAQPLPDGEELCVQAAYTPGSCCFGCGEHA